MAGHHHRTSFKNGHKTFKSKHASKGALKRLFKGKVERDVANNKALKTVSKLQRRNKAKQLRSKKILASIENRKLFEGANGAEKIITVIPLTSDCDIESTMNHLLSSNDVQFEHNGVEQSYVKNYFVKQYKSNLKFIVPNMNNFFNVLDSAKVADFVIFILSGTSEVEPDYGEQIIRALELQGISSYIGVVSNLSQVHPKEKFQLDVKQSLESYFKHFFPNEDRIYNLEKKSDSLNVLRTLCQKFPRPVTWRDSRGYMVADKIDYQDVNQDYCELMVEGTVRGSGFNANRLVHIPNLGDFQISKIEKVKASSRSKYLENKNKKNNKNNQEDPLLEFTDAANQNLFESNENRDTLDEFAPGDLTVNEMDEYEDFEYNDLKSARFDDHGFLPRNVDDRNSVKVPKGTSEYQAKWYLDDTVIDQDDISEEEEEDDDMDKMMDEEDDIDVGAEFDQEGEDHQDDDEEDDMFVELSPEEEERQLQEFRALEKEDREFPDEIELNPSESAIEALKRYRGLKNLHNCIWNVDEKDPECPSEWKRVLRIGNYKNTRNRLLKETIKEVQVIAGDRVRIYLSFPKNLLEKIISPETHAFTLYSLLPHEHKNAVVNFSLQRWEEYDKPVPAEEPIMVQYGIRRYMINPLFSADTNSSNNVHKAERFLHPYTQSVATCIAPVDFTQSPAIFFKPSSTERTGIELIGHGTFLNADHTRVLASRAILTGHPFRFHRSVVTIRYMFFNPEDVEWFKSIPLFTKSGRSGFIKESLGTHGYFKANFDTKLSAQDVVAMSLYKRMWPNTSAPWSAEM